MMSVVETPLTPADFEEYFQLRYLVLRKPWKQLPGSEKDDLEDKSIHAFIKMNNEIAAVGRLHISEQNIGIIRYMAVKTEYHGRGLGKKILMHLEDEALKKNIKCIELNARENAVGFYLKNYYQMVSKAHLLFGEIQHYLMRKTLTKVAE